VDINALKADVIINFGMHMLHDSHYETAPLGVLSFHHSDAAEYGGLAPGFYEVLDGARHVGASVQRFTPAAREGTELASSSHQVVAHSYSRTLDGLYRNSAYLLTKALVNARRGTAGASATTRPEHPIPSNTQMIRFMTVIMRRKLTRALYGATRTKQWRVGHTIWLDPTTSTGMVTLPTPVDIDVPSGFQFMADPLPGPDQSIWCEAMDRKTGLGRIMVLASGQAPQVVDPPGTSGLHLAYPFVVESNGSAYLIPEMSGGRPTQIFTLNGITPVDPRPLLQLEDERLVDPTFHHHAGRWWLFAGKPGSSGELLWLWSSPDVHGPYEPHPANPIVMDPSRARCGGPLIVAGGKLFRPGQNNSGAYGNGLTVSEITDLSMSNYSERPMLELRVASRSGPHTLIQQDGTSVVDSYVDAFDPLAWLHRIKSRF